MKFVYKLNIYNHDQKLLFKLPTIFSPLAPPKLIAYLLTVIFFIFQVYEKKTQGFTKYTFSVSPNWTHLWKWKDKERSGGVYFKVYTCFTLNLNWFSFYLCECGKWGSKFIIMFIVVTVILVWTILSSLCDIKPHQKTWNSKSGQLIIMLLKIMWFNAKH